GALCVSYSGACRASFVSGGRSANRGECAQICRLPYDLTDKDGKILIHDRHLLSLRDMNRLARLGELADAGINSFKIEGRLKSADYVSNITAAYSMALDRLVEGSEGRYVRASAGRVITDFTPDPAKSFNRGFTDYFLSGPYPEQGTMGAHDTPKSIGEPVGTIVKAERKFLSVHSSVRLSNGDGLGYFNDDKRFVGFRANRVEGDKVFPAGSIEGPLPSKGTALYRNFDKAFSDTLSNDKTRRVIDIDMILESYSGGVTLTLRDSRGVSVTAVLEGAFDKARSPQSGPRQRVLERLGDTIYTLKNLDDRAGDIFIPASALTDLRRHAIDMLDHAAAATRPISLRMKKDAAPTSVNIRPANVANSLAEKFYRTRGLTECERAIETVPVSDYDKDEVRVMTTRYCLRRELG
ncbi:MAG: U32 family peptidase, partial [Muribaculaceae bacterium]|nr:U32 family peptidase [Muribaculaceae bacterium]